MELNFAHLYGDLLNTYGDYGNYLVINYLAKQANINLNYSIVSLHDNFEADKFDIALIGGGQDFEQSIVADDFIEKKDDINRFIEQNKVLLAICGGFQLLGQYYVDSNNHKIPGIGVLPHYTETQSGHNRFMGNIEIKNKNSGETYLGFENHNGVTYLGEGEAPLGDVISGNGNNGQDKTEGVIYRNTYGSYFHGPILARNVNLAKRLFIKSLENKYPNFDLTEVKDKISTI